MLDAFRTVDCSLHLPRFEPDRPVSIGSDAWFRGLCGAWRAVPATHVRARLRYEKLVRAARGRALQQEQRHSKENGGR